LTLLRGLVGSKLEKLRVCYQIIDYKNRKKVNFEEMKDFVAQFWLKPIDRIGERRDNKAVIDTDAGNAVRRELEGEMDGMKKKISGLIKWREEAMNLQARQQVLQEMSEKAGKELRESHRQAKLMALERADLLQEGREWAVERESMAQLVRDSAEEAKRQWEGQQSLDRERRLVLLQNEMVVEEYSLLEAQLGKSLTEAESRKAKEMETLRTEMEARVKKTRQTHLRQQHDSNGAVFVRTVVGIVKRWEDAVAMRCVSRWYGYASMERVLIEAGNRLDHEAWLRSGQPKGWERRNMGAGREPKGGTPLGYTTSVILAVPSAAQMMKEGVKDGFQHLEDAGPEHTNENVTLKTPGKKLFKLHQTHSEELRTKVNSRRRRDADGLAPHAEGQGWVPLRPKSGVTRMPLTKPSCSDSHLRMVCLRTLAGIEEPIESAWHSLHGTREWHGPVVKTPPAEREWHTPPAERARPFSAFQGTPVGLHKSTSAVARPTSALHAARTRPKTALGARRRPG